MSRGKITEQELSDSMKQKVLAISTLDEKVSNLQDTLENISITKSEKDVHGVYTLVSYKIKGTQTLHATSKLSGGSGPNYTNRKITYFEPDGITVKKIQSFQLIYDSDGILIEEV